MRSTLTRTASIAAGWCSHFGPGNSKSSGRVSKRGGHQNEDRFPPYRCGTLHVDAHSRGSTAADSDSDRGGPRCPKQGGHRNEDRFPPYRRRTPLPSAQNQLKIEPHRYAQSLRSLRRIRGHWGSTRPWGSACSRSLPQMEKLNAACRRRETTLRRTRNRAQYPAAPTF